MARMYAKISGRVPDAAMMSLAGHSTNTVVIQPVKAALAGLEAIAYSLAPRRLMVRRPSGRTIFRTIRKPPQDAWDVFAQKMRIASQAHAVAASATWCGDPPAPPIFFAGADPGQNLFVVAHALPPGTPLRQNSSYDAVTFARVERAIVSCWLSGIAFGPGFCVSDVMYDVATGRTTIARFDTAYKMDTTKLGIIAPYIDAMNFDALGAAIADAAATHVISRMRAGLSTPQISEARFNVAEALRCRPPKNSSPPTGNAKKKNNQATA